MDATEGGIWIPVPGGRYRYCRGPEEGSIPSARAAFMADSGDTRLLEEFRGEGDYHSITFNGEANRRCSVT